MKTFRRTHILKILNDYSLQKGPLDQFLSLYFKHNKALGSNDRKEVAQTIYSVYRKLGLLNHLAADPNSWESKLDTLPFATRAHPSAAHHIHVSFPEDLFARIEASHGQEKAREICNILNETAPITLRTNTLRCTRDDLTKNLAKQYNVRKTKLSPIGIVLEDRAQLFQTKEFQDGFFEMQDEASQMGALLANTKPGEHVLDYCSGSGGKSLAIALTMEGKGQLYLHDIREVALAQAKKRMKRAGVQNCQIIKPDSKNLKRLKRHMDCVFVDAPCSGTGTYRRNPEQKWRFTNKMLSELLELQREIFANALKYIKPTGRIIYATCSILNEENEEQVEYFLKEHDLEIVGEPLKLLPESGGSDGFFAVELKRRKIAS
ncbi:MAG: RsmB/NOP family class I SAM-dependent RNA methyltransferase [Rhabdochlamydiaceae bacterium]|nr:RsmB/NOP family class I SAM-dependent RNA methyltransferase [Candidatus Amphrikana amoebophyrae]